MENGNKKTVQISNIYDLVNEYRQLPDGLYNNDNLRVNIKSIDKFDKLIKIENDKYDILIKSTIFGFDILFKNNMYNFNIIKQLGLAIALNIPVGNKNYIIYANFPVVDDKNMSASIIVDKKRLEINGNTIKKTINNQYILEYDFKTKKMYIYIAKKSDAKELTDYVEFEYNEKLIESINKINKNYNINYFLLRDFLVNCDEKGLQELLSYKKICNDFSKEFELLKEATEVFNEYHDKLNFDPVIFEEISTFATYLNNINNETNNNFLKSCIKNSITKKINNLKELKNEIKLIKDKKEKKKKLNNK
ncbi:MAG: hypothetical protein IJD92_00175 [Bacilli bacterium]|nr:hypothetical protein [Bacilli bacterium]